MVHVAGTGARLPTDAERDPVLGAIEPEYSAFAVSDRPGLWLVIWNPVSAVDAKRIKTLLAGRTPGKHVARHDRLNVLEPAFEG